MKNYLLSLFIIAFGVANVVAQTPADNKTVNTVKGMPQGYYYYNPQGIAKPGDRMLANKPVNINYTTQPVSQFMENSTPLYYEPYSKTLFVAFGGWYDYKKPNTYDTPAISIYSTSNFTSFAKKDIMKGEDVIPFSTSIGVANPTKKTTLDTNALTMDVFYTYMSPVGNNSYSLDKVPSHYVFVEGESVNQKVNPTNTDGYIWPGMEMATYSSPDKVFFASAGILWNAQNSTSLAGSYGVSGFTSGQEFFATKPDQWDASKFVAPDQDPTKYRTTSDMNIDADEEGTLYAAVDNAFLPNASSVRDRVVGISKSTDEGKTWSDFDPMPISVITDYISSEGGDPQNAIYDQIGGYTYPAYYPNTFIVYGKDQYSYIFRLFVIKSQTEMDAQFVEAYRKDGVWGIRKVASYSGSVPVYIQHNQQSTDDNIDEVFAFPRGNELQVAITADKQYLMTKWVDYTNLTLVLSNPVPVVNHTDGYFDTVNVTDIFTSYRKLSDTQWSEPKNVSSDTVSNKGTWIPRIIPSIDNFPLVQLFTSVSFGNQDYYRAKYPAPMLQLLTDAWLFNTASLYTYSAATAVNDQPEQSYEFSMGEAYPNPANGSVELSFNLDRSSSASMELFNALGQKVMHVFDSSSLLAGPHAVTVKTSDLTSGVYYYTLTVGGKSITKTLTVVH